MSQLQELGTPITPLPLVPDLAGVLFRPLLQQVTVSVPVPADLQHSFIQDQAPLTALELHINSQILKCNRYIMTEYSEDMWGGFHAQYMGDVLELFRIHCNVPITFNRNKAMESSVSVVSRGTRLDSTFRTIPGTLLVGGVEKVPGKLNDAVQDLRDRIPSWNPLVMGELPFLLLFATGGDMVQFHVMDTRCNLLALGPPFSVVGAGAGVMRLTLAVINMVRMMRVMEGLAPPPGSPGLGLEVRRPNSACILTFNTYSVDKVFYGGPLAAKKKPRLFEGGFSPMSLPVLQKLEVFFEALMSVVPKPDCLEVPTYCFLDSRSSNVSVLTVNMAPIGRTRMPATLTELRDAVCAVLRGLRVLHGIGYVHRDVRWANVIFVPDFTGSGMSRWCLIDFGRVALIEEGGDVTADLAAVSRHLMFPLMEMAAGAADFFGLQSYLLRSEATVEGALAHPFLTS